MSNTTKKYLDYTGLSTIANKIKDRLEKVTTMPVSPSNGDTVLYVGATTSSYTKGTIYIYNSSTSSWTPSTTPNGDIIGSNTFGVGATTCTIPITLDAGSIYSLDYYSNIAGTTIKEELTTYSSGNLNITIRKNPVTTGNGTLYVVARKVGSV